MSVILLLYYSKGFNYSPHLLGFSNMGFDEFLRIVGTDLDTGESRGAGGPRTLDLGFGMLARGSGCICRGDMPCVFAKVVFA